MKQVLIGNIKYLFDGMTSTINIAEAKKEFPDHYYVGTSSTIYINGKEQELEHPFRFFKSTSLDGAIKAHNIQALKEYEHRNNNNIRNNHHRSSDSM